MFTSKPTIPMTLSAACAPTEQIAATASLCGRCHDWVSAGSLLRDCHIQINFTGDLPQKCDKWPIPAQATTVIHRGYVNWKWRHIPRTPATVQPIPQPLCLQYVTWFRVHWESCHSWHLSRTPMTYLSTIAPLAVPWWFTDGLEHGSVSPKEMFSTNNVGVNRKQLGQGVFVCFSKPLKYFTSQ